MDGFALTGGLSTRIVPQDEDCPDGAGKGAAWRYQLFHGLRSGGTMRNTRQRMNNEEEKVERGFIMTFVVI